MRHNSVPLPFMVIHPDRLLQKYIQNMNALFQVLVHSWMPFDLIWFDTGLTRKDATAVFLSSLIYQTMCKATTHCINIIHERLCQGKKIGECLPVLWDPENTWLKGRRIKGLFISFATFLFFVYLITDFQLFKDLIMTSSKIVYERCTYCCVTCEVYTAVSGVNCNVHCTLYSVLFSELLYILL